MDFLLLHRQSSCSSRIEVGVERTKFPADKNYFDSETLLTSIDIYGIKKKFARISHLPHALFTFLLYDPDLVFIITLK